MKRREFVFFSLGGTMGGWQAGEGGCGGWPSFVSELCSELNRRGSNPWRTYKWSERELNSALLKMHFAYII